MSNNGHVTRFSDSSLYDEVCINCGDTEPSRRPCPKPVGQGGKTLDQYYADLDRRQRPHPTYNPGV